MKNIYVLAIHGIQDKELKDSFADGFIKDIKNGLKTNRNVVFSAFNWSKLVHDRQMSAFGAFDSGLSKGKLRELKNTYGSDLLWYGRSKNTASGIDIYDQIHLGLEREIDDMIRDHGSEDFDIVLLGHSWGTQIALDHCFESKHTISGLITMGSPIGAVSGCFPDWGHLPDGLKFWANFWNDKDFISSPLQNHPSKSIGSFVRDFRVESWNPMTLLTLRAHTYYWDSSFVKNIIAETLSAY